jgi:hypothetical protein
MSEVQEDFQDIFEDEPEKEVEIVEEAAEPEAEETPPEAEPEAEEAEESEVETTATEKKEWTLSAVLDEREKRQKAVAEAEELRKELAKYKAEKPEDDISIFEDEKGFIARQKQETEVALRNTALNMSEAFAESVFGEEKVAAAKQWMINEGIKSPYALEQFNAAKLPYHAAVKLYEDDQARRDPEAYKAKLREEILAELQEKKPKPSTPSLASKRSVGSKTEAEDFDDLLKE